MKLLGVDWLLRIHLLRRRYGHAVRLRRNELDVVPVRSRDQSGGIAAVLRRVTEYVRRSHGSLTRRVNVVILRWWRRRVRHRFIPRAGPVHGVVRYWEKSTLTVARLEERVRGVARAGKAGTAKRFGGRIRGRARQVVRVGRARDRPRSARASRKVFRCRDSL